MEKPNGITDDEEIDRANTTSEQLNLKTWKDLTLYNNKFDVTLLAQIF